MKRFLAFGGEHYYPHGGMDDFSGSYDTKEEAISVLVKEATAASTLGDGVFSSYWAHIFDTELNQEVWTDRNYEAKEIKTTPPSSPAELPSHGQESEASQTGVPGVQAPDVRSGINTAGLAGDWWVNITNKPNES